MSRPRFLADHDLNQHIVAGVLRREPVVTFVTSRELRLERSPDAAVLEFAASESLVVVSHDASTMTAAAFAHVRPHHRSPEGGDSRRHRGSHPHLGSDRCRGVAESC